MKSKLVLVENKKSVKIVRKSTTLLKAELK